MPARVDSLKCLCITGPTACGKTALALELAERLPIEVVSMDSAMVYRGMDIGTAKPDAATLGRVRHHLIDILEPEEAYSAGRFAADARRAVADIRARDRVPVLVGGTMLYLKALREGIAPLPERDCEVRAEIDRDAALEGWPAMHARLQRIDPVLAARIEPTDRQRIQRALEVHALTGRPLSELQAAKPDEPPLSVVSFALMPPDRAELGRVIEQRFAAMLAAGLIDEVRRLRARPDLRAENASMRAVGYRQVWAHLDGQWSREEAERRAIVATRQLAKRQLTWLRTDLRSVQLLAGDPRLAATVAAAW